MTEWYYSSKGQRQGPVSEEELRKLFLGDQLESGALVWHEGMKDWELAQTVLLQVPPVPGAPLSPTQEVRESGIYFDRIFSNGWRSFAEYWPIALVIFILFLILVIVLQMVPESYFSITFEKFFRIKSFWLAFFCGEAISSAYGIILIPILSPFSAGMEFFYIEAARGRANFGNLFAGFTRSWLQVVLFALVFTFLSWVGLLLFIIPGIYLSVCYMYSDNLIVDQKMGFWEAMELSRKTVHRHWFSVFALILLELILTISGFFLCLIGIFFTPLLACFFYAESYRQLFPQFQKPAE